MDTTTQVAKVDRDYLNEKWNREGGEHNNTSNVGVQWTVAELHQHSDFDERTHTLPSDKTRFRLLDDDGEVYYGGWLLDDDGCNVQMIVLEWGTYDSGCTAIEIRSENNEWVRDIG